MFQTLVVPVDSWSTSSTSVRIAATMAARVGGSVDVITVVDDPSDTVLARNALERGIQQLGPLPVEPHHVAIADESVAAAIARYVESTPGSMVLMSAHGRGRSAVVLGSTCDDLLRTMFGPIIVVGPNAVNVSGGLDGTYVVPLDGSPRADGVLPIVAAWTTEFGGTPWLIEVGSGDSPSSSGDFIDSGFVMNRAMEMRRRINRAVEFEVLHDGHAAQTIATFAGDSHASLIFMATHGRTGLDRLRTGSVAAGVIRHAHCPVVLFRPPDLPGSRTLAATGGTAVS